MNAIYNVRHKAVVAYRFEIDLRQGLEYLLRQRPLNGEQRRRA